MISAYPSSFTQSQTFAEVESQMQAPRPVAWVKTSERLPQPGEEVLFYMPMYRSRMIDRFHPANDYVAADHFTLASCEIWDLSRVSHWAPLPPPPGAHKRAE